MLYSFKLSVLLTTLLLQTVTSKRDQTASQSHTPQTKLITLREVNEQDYDEDSGIFELPIVAGPRDLGALLALQTTTTQKPHYDHHEHHYHHHPTRRPPKRRPRPCSDDDEDSDDCVDNYYVRPSWHYTPTWYATPPQPPPVVGPHPSYYGPQPIYYPQPSYYPQQYYPQQYYPQQHYPQQHHPQQHHPQQHHPPPYYPPSYSHNYPPWHIYNHTHTADQPLPGSVLGDSIRIPSQLLKMKLREPTVQLFAKPKPVCVARPNKSVYQPAIFVYEQRIADLD
nr:adhesive plaque matrix protein-like [Bactrocera oleae]